MQIHNIVPYGSGPQSAQQLPLDSVEFITRDHMLTYIPLPLQA